MKLTLKQWRTLRGVSREELAYKSGVSSKTIENYERDISSLRKASWEKVDKMCSVLEIKLDDIDLTPISEK